MELGMKLQLLTDKLEQMNAYRPLSREAVNAINKEKKIEHVYTSNALEGNTLDKYETASILETGMTLHGVPVKDVLETLDLSKAYDHMEELAVGKVQLTEDDIRDLNRLCTIKSTDMVEFAGLYRQIQAYPYGVAGVKYSEPYLIGQEMGNLVWWMNTLGKEMHPVRFAAELHQKFVTIHPFSDGNGRTARLLMEFALTSNGYPITNIQPDVKSRTQYMETLAQTQRSGDVTPFIHLVSDYVSKELDFRIQTLELNEKNMQDYEAYLKKSKLENSGGLDKKTPSNKFEERLIKAEQEKKSNSTLDSMTEQKGRSI